MWPTHTTFTYFSTICILYLMNNWLEMNKPLVLKIILSYDWLRNIYNHVHVGNAYHHNLSESICGKSVKQCQTITIQTLHTFWN